jgi:phage terminase small subunit
LNKAEQLFLKKQVNCSSIITGESKGNNMSQENSLTAKQKKFCKEYMVDCNAKQAAIRAGYSRRTAKSIGQENLTKPDLAEFIQVLRDKQSEDTGITAKYVSDSIRAIADNDDATDNNRLKAYEFLGRHLAMFTDRTEHIHPEMPPHISSSGYISYIMLYVSYQQIPARG